MAESKARGASGPIIFIVGGLVVAVGVLFWFFMGGDAESISSGGGDPDVNISVDSSTESAPAAEPAPAEPTPAEPAPAEPAPAETGN